MAKIQRATNLIKSRQSTQYFFHYTRNTQNLSLIIERFLLSLIDNFTLWKNVKTVRFSVLLYCKLSLINMLLPNKNHWIRKNTQKFWKFFQKSTFNSAPFVIALFIYRIDVC